MQDMNKHFLKIKFKPAPFFPVIYCSIFSSTGSERARDGDRERKREWEVECVRLESQVN